MAGFKTLSAPTALILSAALGACAATDVAPPETLTLVKTSGGLLHASAQFGDTGPFTLLVDTGSERSAIDGTIVRQLEIPLQQQTFDIYGLFSVDTVSGSPMTSVNAGPFSNQSPLMIMGLPKAGEAISQDGILGVDMLMSLRESHRYLVLDFETPQVSARRALDRRLRQSVYAWHDLLTLNPNFPDFLIVEVYLGGVRGHALIDSGLSISVMNHSFADELALRGRAQFSDLMDANGTVLAPMAVPSRPFKAMGLEWNRVRMLVHDAAAFEPLGMANGPAMLLGADLLNELVLIVDTKRRVIAASPRSERTSQRIDGVKFGSDWINGP